MDIDIGSILNEEIKFPVISESAHCGRVKNIFDDEHITFAEISDIFRSIFNGRTNVMEHTDGQNLYITHKDGDFYCATDENNIRNPQKLSEIGSSYKGNPEFRDAFVGSTQDLATALASIDKEALEGIFGNGRKFLNAQIVNPPQCRLIDYGNRCLINLGTVDVYGADMGKIEGDQESSDKIYDLLSKHNALKQEMSEIRQPTVLKMKNYQDGEESLKTLLGDLSKLVEGIGYNATIQDYVNDRLKREIVNQATSRGMNVSFNSDFVNELANRLSYVSHKRPTKADLMCFAKRDGINVRSPEYKDLLERLHSTSDSINENIMRPIESLVLKASNLLFKNMIGFMSVDPNRNSQKIVHELEETINSMNVDDVLTDDKMRKFRKNVKMLEEYQDEKIFPTEGIIFKYRNNNGELKTYKMVGSFGPVSQLLNIIGR